MFQTSLRLHNQLTQEDQTNYFYSLMRADVLQTLKNITGLKREHLGEVLTVFRTKYVKPLSMATAKHKFQRSVFNPANQKLVDFLDELQKLAKNAFGVATKAIIEQTMYAKTPQNLKNSVNQARLENGTNEQNALHLEKELELKGLEVLDETQKKTVTQQATKPNRENPKPTCHHCKKPSHYRNQCRQLKKKEDQNVTKKILSVATIIVITPVVKQTRTPTTSKPLLMEIPAVQTTEMIENQELSTHPVIPVAKRTTPERNAFVEPMQQTDCFLGMEDRWSKVKINNKTHRSKQLKLSWLRPKLSTKNATSLLRNYM